MSKLSRAYACNRIALGERLQALFLRITVLMGLGSCERERGLGRTWCYSQEVAAGGFSRQRTNGQRRLERIHIGGT